MLKIIILQEENSPITIETNGAVVIYDEGSKVFSTWDKSKTLHSLIKNSASIVLEDLLSSSIEDPSEGDT